MLVPVRISGTTRINLSPNSLPEATSPLTPALSARTANNRTTDQLLALRGRGITGIHMV